METEDTAVLMRQSGSDIPRGRRGWVELWLLLLFSFVVLAIGIGIGLLIRRNCPGNTTDSIDINKKSRQLQELVDPAFLLAQLNIMSSKVHQAGSASNNHLADIIARDWKGWGLGNTQLFKYNINKTVVNVTSPNVVRLLYNESIVIDFVTVELNGNLPRYHAYSSKGRAKGRYVFINYGLTKDLQTLRKLNVTFCDTGIIAIVRLGFSDRGAKVKNLISFCGDSLPGGLLVYPDPWDYSVDFHNKSSNPDNTPVYPDSWWLPGDAAVFGSMKMKSGLQSPDLPSVGGIFNTVNITTMLTPFPVQPISYNDARTLFSYMNGTKVPKSWERSLAHFIESTDHYEIEMVISNNVEERTLVNVIGNIPGSVEKDRYVILGNHRDAWAFGASDPGSGTIILQQVVKILSAAYKKGIFRPRRTIIFANWDGEEEGLLGSTEFTSQFSSDLTQRCIAYINMDCPVKGNWSFVGRSTPLIIGPMLDSSKNVFISPGYTLFDDWRKKNPQPPGNVEPKVSSLGGGSDHNLFAYVLGVPSAYPEYKYNESLPSMPSYHTKYDNIDMMLRLLDPQLKHHALVSKFVIDYLVRLSYSPIIPYSLLRLTSLLLEKYPLLKQEICSINFVNESSYPDIIHGQLVQFNDSASAFMDIIKSRENEIIASPERLRTVNDMLMQMPRMFITREGLPTRPYLRNILLSTRLVNSYQGSIFTGVMDAVDLFKSGKVSLEVVLRQMSLLSNSLRQCVDLLRGSLVHFSI